MSPTTTTVSREWLHRVMGFLHDVVDGDCLCGGHDVSEGDICNVCRAEALIKEAK